MLRRPPSITCLPILCVVCTGSRWIPDFISCDSVCAVLRKWGFVPFSAGANVQTNEEVAIKLVNGCPLWMPLAVLDVRVACPCARDAVVKS